MLEMERLRGVSSAEDSMDVNKLTLIFLMEPGRIRSAPLSEEGECACGQALILTDGDVKKICRPGKRGV